MLRLAETEVPSRNCCSWIVYRIVLVLDIAGLRPTSKGAGQKILRKTFSNIPLCVQGPAAIGVLKRHGACSGFSSTVISRLMAVCTSISIVSNSSGRSAVVLQVGIAEINISTLRKPTESKGLIKHPSLTFHFVRNSSSGQWAPVNARGTSSASFQRVNWRSRHKRTLRVNSALGTLDLSRRGSASTR